MDIAGNPEAFQYAAPQIGIGATVIVSRLERTIHCRDLPQQLRPVAKNTAAKYRRAALVATVGPDLNFSAGTVCSRRETAVADFIVIAYRNISVDRLDHGSRKQRISATQYHLRP